MIGDAWRAVSSERFVMCMLKEVVVHTEEEGFIAELDEQASKDEWKDFAAIRLIFADWLAERGDPREGITRAPWRMTERRMVADGTSVLRETWEVGIPPSGKWRDPEHRMMIMFGHTVNAWRLLHFPIGTLKLMDDFQGRRPTAIFQLRFTFQLRRLSFNWYDIGAVHGGFMAFFNTDGKES